MDVSCILEKGLDKLWIVLSSSLHGLNISADSSHSVQLSTCHFAIVYRTYQYVVQCHGRVSNDQIDCDSEAVCGCKEI